LTHVDLPSIFMVDQKGSTSWTLHSLLHSSAASSQGVFVAALKGCFRVTTVGADVGKVASILEVAATEVEDGVSRLVGDVEAGHHVAEGVTVQSAPAEAEQANDPTAGEIKYPA
jgi:hypothetical protein